MTGFETMTLQAAPREEAPLVEALRSFGWLLRARRARGGYVELVFARALAIPGLERLRRLEAEFFSMEPPPRPDPFPGRRWAWAVLALCGGIGILVWLAYYVVSFRHDRRAADRLSARFATARGALRARAEERAADRTGTTRTRCP